MRELFRRLRYLLHRGRFDQELADEMEFHREMAARADGAPVGNTLRLREEARDAWGWTWMDRLGQDLRYALRMVRRSPGFSLTAVLMLTIGIGVNIAAFGFINAAFLRPLPVRYSSTLLRFERRAPDRFATEVPYPEMAFVRDHTRTLSAVLAAAPVRLTLDDEPQPVEAHFVTGNFFGELGASASMGRLLGLDHDRGAVEDPAVVLSHAFWRRRFDADTSIIGRSIRLNHRPATVIGVASDTFGGLSLDGPDLWIALSRHTHFVRGGRLLTTLSQGDGVRMWGRMHPGLTPGVVEEELASLVKTFRAQHPADIWEHERLVSEPGAMAGRGNGSGDGTGAPRPTEAYAVIGMVGALAFLILAVACGNLGSLLLARGVSRDREMGVRVAVGAGAPRLVRQLFTESLVLASLGAILGLALGQGILKVAMTMADGPVWLDMAPDWRVALFTIGVTVGAAILFGLAPAMHIARRRRRSTTLRQVLIGAQVAASCVLLIVAGLLVRALQTMASVDPGFAYQQVIAINPSLGAHGYSPERAAVYLSTLRGQLAAMPGITSVGSASNLPLGSRKTVVAVEVDGRQVDIHLNHVDAGFLPTMGIPMQRGRPFEGTERGTMLVSESLTQALWPGQDVIGKVFIDRTIVGVVGSARQTALQDVDAVEAYVPLEPSALPSLLILVKTSGPPEDLVRAVTGRAAAIDPDVIVSVEMLKTAFQRKLEETQLTAVAVSILGVAALVLACVGIVGLVAYAVAQRTKEIGIRIALGAQGSQVIGAGPWQLWRPVAIGLILGTGAAAALSQLLRRELYGVSHVDPSAYLMAIAVFVASVALAGWWPARRALRVDPLRALRTD